VLVEQIVAHSAGMSLTGNAVTAPVASSAAVPDLAGLASLLANPSRALFCLTLLDGRAWTAGELARRAGIARRAATEHLTMLVQAGLLAEEHQGRHRYLRLADADTAELIEYLTSRAPRRADPARTLRSATTDNALARGRTCYDHLAGRIGVALTDAMTDRDLLRRTDGWTITADGLAWITELGIDLAQARRTSRPLARSCLDWTERRPHLAGAAGAAICHQLLELGWLSRIGTGRAVRPTLRGRRELLTRLGLDLPEMGPLPAGA
jgi:DNA-binding transcriptional ArsR family regulator